MVGKIRFNNYVGERTMARCRFKNNGKPFEITTNMQDEKVSFYDGNLSRFDDDIVSVELIETTEKVGLFKKTRVQYTLKVTYKFGGINPDIYQKNVMIDKTEVEEARRICDEATAILREIKTKAEARKKANDEKLQKARRDDTIEAIDLDGNIIKIWRRECFLKDKVLYSDGGEAYHTHADCFEFWKPAHRRKFDKWKIISRQEAKDMGLRECKFCEEYYDFDEDDD